jgi:hypothetical protein
MVQNKQKKGFCAIFGHFGAPSNRPKKIHKILQVSGMSRLMSELKNKPLTKSLGPFFFRRNSPKQPENSFFNSFWLFLAQMSDYCGQLGIHMGS